MTLISFRLFRKNLGKLRDFFGQMVYRPPPGKKCPVRLCETITFSAKLKGSHPWEGDWRSPFYSLRNKAIRYL